MRVAKTKTPARPLSKLEVSDIPKAVMKNTGPKRSKDVWGPTMKFVREQKGRTVKICVHPKARNILSVLRKEFPDLAFASRSVPVDRGTSFGIWAWLKTDADNSDSPPPGVPPPPVDPLLEKPLF